MDFECIYDIRQDKHQIQISGEQGALGRFLNSELADKPELLMSIEALLQALDSNQSNIIEFTEWSIECDGEDIRIFHHSMHEQGDNDSEFDNYLDWQFEVSCGKGDLVGLLLTWIDFIENQYGN